MKLHSVSDGPPSLACRMVLKALNIPFELVNVNYNIGEHLTDEYAKVNFIHSLTRNTVSIDFICMNYFFRFLVESAERNPSS